MLALPERKWNWTAAWSFFRAREPFHIIGYFLSKARSSVDWFRGRLGMGM